MSNNSFTTQPTSLVFPNSPSYIPDELVLRIFEGVDPGLLSGVSKEWNRIGNGPLRYFQEYINILRIKHKIDQLPLSEAEKEKNLDRKVNIFWAMRKFLLYPNQNETKNSPIASEIDLEGLPSLDNNDVHAEDAQDIRNLVRSEYKSKQVVKLFFDNVGIVINHLKQVVDLDIDVKDRIKVSEQMQEIEDFRTQYIPHRNGALSEQYKFFGTFERLKYFLQEEQNQIFTPFTDSWRRVYAHITKLNNKEQVKIFYSDPDLVKSISPRAIIKRIRDICYHVCEIRLPFCVDENSVLKIDHYYDFLSSLCCIPLNLNSSDYECINLHFFPPSLGDSFKKMRWVTDLHRFSYLMLDHESIVECIARERFRGWGNILMYSTNDEELTKKILSNDKIVSSVPFSGSECWAKILIKVGKNTDHPLCSVFEDLIKNRGDILEKLPPKGEDSVKNILNNINNYSLRNLIMENHRPDNANKSLVDRLWEMVFSKKNKK